MTTYGERVARELAGACASEGVVVVSGLAQGIDSAAHRGALDAGGRTVAVLGEGITLFLATVRGRRRQLVPRIRANGALVSQYAPSFCARPWMFVRRNTTIAALAFAVVVVEAGEARVSSAKATRNPAFGTMRANIQNMVLGVTQGFSKTLEIVGTGYRAQMEGKDLVLQVGFSHPVRFVPPAGVAIKVENPTRLTVSGADKAVVGQVAADIRGIRPPEPYKGKGIKYEGEYIRRKAGKAAGATGTT